MRCGTNKTVISLAAALALLLLTSIASAQQAQEYNLRPQWKEGQAARYEVWTSREQEATITIAGQKRSSGLKMTSEGEINWKVDKVKADGSSTCTMTLEWLSLSLLRPDGELMTNDSRKSSGDIPPYHEMLKAMMGVPLKVSVAADGTVTKVDGINAISSRIKADYKDMVPEELDFIETATDLATLVAAPESTTVGKKWDADMKWTWADRPFEGFLSQNMKYTFSNVEDLAGVPIAIIDGKAKLKLDLDRSSIPENLPPADVKLVKGELQTQIMYDLSRHEAVGRNSTQTTTIDFTIRAPSTTIQRRLIETIQGQVLRVAEE